jgi:putative tricarboxylic transport membrane protein
VPILLTNDRISGSLLALFALWVIWESRNLPFGTFRNPGPGYMPILLASTLLFFGAVIVWTGAKTERSAPIRWKEISHPAAVLAACIFAALGMERLGYRLTILLVAAVLLKAIERKNWFSTMVLAVILAFGTFYVFYTLLRVPLPFGPLGI